MFIAMVLDHDIQINGKQVAPDFTVSEALPIPLVSALWDLFHSINAHSSQRASLIFPFVDRLNNGHTPFRYGGPILFSTNPAIIATQPGFRNTYFGTFDPACEAYAADPGSKKSDGFTYVKAWLGDGEVKGERPSFDTKFRVSEEKYGFDV